MSESGPIQDAYSGHYDAKALVVIICSALAGYNAAELILLIFTTFRTYKGLYFWSLLIATIGIVPYAAGLCIFYFDWTVRLFGYIINALGWIAVVSGQSVVLYSRLGLVLGKGHEKLLRFVKWIIIVDAIVFHGSTVGKFEWWTSWKSRLTTGSVVVFPSRYGNSQTQFAQAYRYIEKIQMTGFTFQEAFISGLYISKTLDILSNGSKNHRRRIVVELLLINIIIISLDIGLLTLEYMNLYVPEVAFKILSYSIKLKLEFAILGKLVESSHNVSQNLPGCLRHDSASWSNDTVRASSSGGQISSTVGCTSRPQWKQDLENPEVSTEGRSRMVSDAGLMSANNDEILRLPSASRCDCSSEDAAQMYAEAIRVVSK